jgi:hypothetical protein
VTATTDTDLLVPALLSAADAHVTGRLSTSLPDGDAAEVYVNQGRVYGVVVRDGSRTLGERLVSNGALSPADLEFALEAQRNDVPGWRIGELVVHLGFVGPDQVQACLAEQMQEMVGWLLSQPPTPWHLRRGSRTRAALAAPLEVVHLLAALGVRLNPQPGPAGLPIPVQAQTHTMTPEDLSAGDVLTMDRSDAMAALRALTDAQEEPEDDENWTSSRRGLGKLLADAVPRPRPEKDKKSRFGRRPR